MVSIADRDLIVNVHSTCPNKCEVIAESPGDIGILDTDFIHVWSIFSVLNHVLHINRYIFIVHMVQ